jgi:GINS complex subunit 2
LILHHAAGDVPGADKVRTLVKDIADLREGKIRAGLKQIHAETQVIKLNNISLAELNQIRPLCIQALDDFRALSTDASAAPRQSSSSSSSSPSQSQSQPEPSQPESQDEAPAPTRPLRRFR